MKVQCPRCRDIVEMSNFSTSDAGLRFTCPACGEDTFLANPQRAPENEKGPGQPAEPASGDEAAVELVECPKCGHAQVDSYACHRCGLVFARFDPATLPAVPEALEHLWQQLLEHPEDETLHRSFQQQALATGHIEYASRQYRRLGRQAGCQELAARELARLQARAQAQLLPATLVKPERGDPRHRGRLAMWVLSLLAAGLFAYFVLRAADIISVLGG